MVWFYETNEKIITFSHTQNHVHISYILEKLFGWSFHHMNKGQFQKPNLKSSGIKRCRELMQHAYDLYCKTSHLHLQYGILQEQVLEYFLTLYSIVWSGLHLISAIGHLQDGFGGRIICFPGSKKNWNQNKIPRH